MEKRTVPASRFNSRMASVAPAGAAPKIVSERLGHASVGVTLDTYSHVLPVMQAEAARAFDELFAG